MEFMWMAYFFCGYTIQASDWGRAWCRLQEVVLIQSTLNKRVTNSAKYTMRIRVADVTLAETTLREVFWLIYKDQMLRKGQVVAWGGVILQAAR